MTDDKTKKAAWAALTLLASLCVLMTARQVTTLMLAPSVAADARQRAALDAKERADDAARARQEALDAAYHRARDRFDDALIRRNRELTSVRIRVLGYKDLNRREALRHH